eukprot:gnl/MRDRNA2_/MRDRNA2_32838_c0_seq1.p1 gnl/MRDRNA2_/MRDRNA2_32838_c0~~gnl/MRDRNA2_/MRDRNA2_32838_c0_seq1.p1  ORF type:complete len:365 (-),score=88.37 gnl/MRDRNA2_/MRDRNA2_32838_c0_seq1:21-1115(-)
MESIPGTIFFKCKEEEGLPAKLISEKDLWSFPAGTDVKFKYGKYDYIFGGCRARLTTHRLVWRTAANWQALRLDGVASAQLVGGWIRSKKIQITLCEGTQLSMRCDSDPAALEAFLGYLESAINAKGWLQGSYEVPQMGGLQRVLALREQKLQASREGLNEALVDLDSLKQNATKLVETAKRLKGQTSSAGSEEGVDKMLRDCGLLQAGDDKLILEGASLSEEVSTVCSQMLQNQTKMGGIVLVHDLFCVVNRRRGTAMVSTDEFMAALRACSGAGGSLRLQSLGRSGVLGVALASATKDSRDAELLALIAEKGPVSAARLASLVDQPVSLAQLTLLDAEERAVVCRDDSLEGIKWHRNFFFDY